VERLADLVGRANLFLIRDRASSGQSLRSVSKSPISFRKSPRFGAGTRDQDLKASRADVTALSTSSALESGNSPITSAVSAGFVSVNVWSLLALSHWPAM